MSARMSSLLIEAAMGAAAAVIVDGAEDGQTVDESALVEALVAAVVQS